MHRVEAIVLHVSDTFRGQVLSGASPEIQVEARTPDECARRLRTALRVSGFTKIHLTIWHGARYSEADVDLKSEE